MNGNDRFAISAPENGITESFDSQAEFETALDRLGFPSGYCHEVVRALESRGIVWLELDAREAAEILKSLGHSRALPEH